jgi:hypothetical protein
VSLSCFRFAFLPLPVWLSIFVVHSKWYFVAICTHVCFRTVACLVCSCPDGCCSLSHSNHWWSFVSLYSFYLFHRAASGATQPSNLETKRGMVCLLLYLSMSCLSCLSLAWQAGVLLACPFVLVYLSVCFSFSTTIKLRVREKGWPIYCALSAVHPSCASFVPLSLLYLSLHRLSLPCLCLSQSV